MTKKSDTEQAAAEAAAEQAAMEAATQKAREAVQAEWDRQHGHSQNG